MKIQSGVTDQHVYFVAVDNSDFVTRETGLSGFTVYRSRNGAAAAAMSSPTTAELDATNMAGVYSLLLDEDMTIAAGNDTEEMVFHITKTGMAPVTRTIELYRPKVTTGETLTVSSGHVSRVTLCDTTTANTDMRGTDSAFLAASAPSNFSSLGINASGHVDRVTLCDTTTTNTDMVGTNNALLASSAPSNFSSLGINGSGHVDRVTLCDTTTANTDMRGTDSAFLASSAPSNFSSLGINASGHVERLVLCDTTTANTDMVGTNNAFLAANAPTNFADLAITASTGKVTVGTNDDKTGYTLVVTPPTSAEIYTYFTDGTREDQFKADISSLATSSSLTSVATDVTSIKGVSDKLDTAMVIDGAVYQFTTNALENAPSGGGGGSTAADIYTYFTDGAREDVFKADSTLAKQDSILAKLSTTTQVFTDPDMANPRKISIIRGDAYDGVSWPAKSWDVGRDINGKTFRFTIKDAIDGTVVFQSTGTGSGQLAAPTITSTQSLNLQATETGDEYYWDIEIEYSATSFGTPLYGTVEVIDDVTTPGDRT